MRLPSFFVVAVAVSSWGEAFCLGRFVWGVLFGTFYGGVLFGVFCLGRFTEGVLRKTFFYPNFCNIIRLRIVYLLRKCRSVVRRCVLFGTFYGGVLRRREFTRAFYGGVLFGAFCGRRFLPQIFATSFVCELCIF